MYFLNYVWSFECCWAYSNGWIQQDGIHQRNLKKLINIFHFRILCLVCITSRGTIAGTGTRWSTSTSIGYRPTWHLSKKYFWYGALDFMLIYELNDLTYHIINAFTRICLTLTIPGVAFQTQYSPPKGMKSIASNANP